MLAIPRLLWCIPLVVLMVACGDILPLPSGGVPDGAALATPTDPAPLRSANASGTPQGDAGTASDASTAALACAPVAHDDGLGHVYRSCAALGDCGELEAQHACAAFAGANESAGCVVSCGGLAVVAVPSDPTAPGAAWGFDGGGRGRVSPFVGAMVCPTSSSATWQ